MSLSEIKLCINEIQSYTEVNMKLMTVNIEDPSYISRMGRGIFENATLIKNIIVFATNMDSGYKIMINIQTVLRRHVTSY